MRGFGWVDDPLVPLGVIPWTVETFFTTLLCVVEIWKWDDRTDAIKWGLMGCYGPYLVICEFFSSSSSYSRLTSVAAWLFVVMYGRVKEALVLQRQQQVKIKGQ